MEYQNYKILFFEQFPHKLKNYDNVPLKIINGTYLDFKPNITELTDEYDQKLYKAIDPMQFCPGVITSRLCLKTDEPNNNSNWQVIKLLRLIKPFFISVSGSLDYKNQRELNTKSERYYITTSINCDNQDCICINKKNNTHYRCNHELQDCFYTEEDFAKVKSLDKKIKSLEKSFPKNCIINSFNLFSEATITSKTYNSVLLLLFAALESLFKSPANAEKLSSYTNIFIGDSFTENIKDFIKIEYINSRNPISHGNPTSNGKPFIKNSNILILLHEIIRLSIIKFLTLNNEALNTYFEQKIKSKNQKTFEEYLSTFSRTDEKLNYYKYQPKKI